MEKVWLNYVDQTGFTKYTPWQSSYENDTNNLSSACTELWRRMFVWWDGRINPCDTDYKSNLSPGNIKNFDFDLMKSWQSENYLKLRNQHLNKKRKELTPCRSCVVT